MGPLRDKQKCSVSGEGDSERCWSRGRTWAWPGVSTGWFAQAEALTWSRVPWDSMEGPRGEGEPGGGPLWFTHSSFHFVCDTRHRRSQQGCV